MRRAFTLLELLIVIVIVGILAAITLPNFTKLVEKSKADQAATYLRVIRTGEKIYWSDNSAYTGNSAWNAGNINSALKTEITDENYQFSVTCDASATMFLATAKRRTDTTQTITLSDTGYWDGTSPYKPSN